jgi:hypothetical protein
MRGWIRSLRCLWKESCEVDAVVWEEVWKDWDEHSIVSCGEVLATVHLKFLPSPDQAW